MFYLMTNKIFQHIKIHLTNYLIVFFGVLFLLVFFSGNFFNSYNNYGTSSFESFDRNLGSFSQESDFYKTDKT